MHMVAKMCVMIRPKEAMKRCSQSHKYTTYGDESLHKVSSMYWQYIPEVSERYVKRVY